MTITLLIPGSGITPFNVWDLSLFWWRRYVAQASALQQQAQERSRVGAASRRR